MPDTAHPRSLTFRLGELTVHPDRNTITGPDGARRIEPMSMRLLLLLARAAPRTVSRDEIVEGLWAGRVVSDDAVTKQISKLRAALGDDPREPLLLQTVAKVGVRLLAPATFDVGDETGPRGGNWRRVLPVIGGLGLAAAAVMAALWFAGERDQGVVTQIPLTATPGVETDPALSPDGAWLAWAAREPGDAGWALYVRLVREETARRITPAGAAGRAAAWSSDGRLAFVLREGSDCAIAVGSPLGDYRRLGPCVAAETGGLAWAGPDRLLFSDRDGVGRAFRIIRLDLRTGRREVLTHPPAGTVGDVMPAVSPVDGRIYFLRIQSLGPGKVMRLDRAPGATTALTGAVARPAGLAALSDGSLLMVAVRESGAPALWRFEPSSRRWRQAAPAAADRFGASRDGRAIAVSHTAADIALTRAPTAGGPGEVLAPSTGVEWSPVLSPDGRAVAFISDRSGAPELWYADLAGGAARRATFLNAADLQDPAWSPDGRRLAFATPVDGQYDIFVVDLNGGAARRLWSTPADERHPAFTPDGRALYFSRRSGPRHTLLRRDLATGREDEVAVGGVRALPSPDGRTLYFGKAFTDGLYRLDLHGGQETKITSWPSWAGLRNWTLADGAVWGVAGAGEDARLMRWTGSSMAVVRPLGDINRRSGVAVAGGQVLYARLGGLESDLTLIQTTR